MEATTKQLSTDLASLQPSIHNQAIAVLSQNFAKFNTESFENLSKGLIMYFLNSKETILEETVFCIFWNLLKQISLENQFAWTSKLIRNLADFSEKLNSESPQTFLLIVKGIFTAQYQAILNESVTKKEIQDWNRTLIDNSLRCDQTKQIFLELVRNCDTIFVGKCINSSSLFLICKPFIDVR